MQLHLIVMALAHQANELLAVLCNEHPGITLLADLHKHIDHGLQQLSTPLLVKFLTKAHASIYIKVGVEAHFNMAVLHEADVSDVVELCSVLEGKLSYLELI